MCGSARRFDTRRFAGVLLALPKTSPGFTRMVRQARPKEYSCILSPGIHIAPGLHGSPKWTLLSC